MPSIWGTCCIYLPNRVGADETIVRQGVADRPQHEPQPARNQPQHAASSSSHEIGNAREKQLDDISRTSSASRSSDGQSSSGSHKSGYETAIQHSKSVRTRTVRLSTSMMDTTGGTDIPSQYSSFRSVDTGSKGWHTHMNFNLDSTTALEDSLVSRLYTTPTNHPQPVLSQVTQANMAHADMLRACASHTVNN